MGPWDVSVYLAVAGVLGLAATIAIIVPAIRAAGIAPVVALTQE